jgi:hypothetical protein
MAKRYKRSKKCPLAKSVPRSVLGYVTMFMLKRKKRKEKRGKRGEKRKEFRIF